MEDKFNCTYSLDGTGRIIVKVPTIKLNRRFNMFQARCDCDEYLRSMPQIESAQVLAYTHGLKYTGRAFIICPWCGFKLKEVENKIRKE